MLDGAHFSYKQVVSIKRVSSSTMRLVNGCGDNLVMIENWLVISIHNIHLLITLYYPHLRNFRVHITYDCGYWIVFVIFYDLPSTTLSNGARVFYSDPKGFEH